jgi:hypothetical protein
MLEPIQINLEGSVFPLSIMIMILIYAVSLSTQSAFKLNIHNKCLNIDLISPICVTDYGLVYYKPPGYKVCVGDTMKSGFIVHKTDYRPDGTLIYRLQRKRPHKSTEIGKATSNIIQFLIIWRISESKELSADILLIEHDKRLGWNKDDLVKLNFKNMYRFRMYPDSAKEVWFLDANTTLVTTFKIMHEDRTLDITISEVKRDNNARMPTHIDLKK